MTAIDNQSAAYRAGFVAGADAERDRIAEICADEAAQKLPADALVLALATDLDGLSARLNLSQRARLPEDQRGPLTTPCGGYDPVIKRDAQGKTIRSDASAAAPSPHGNAASWDSIVADLNRDVARAKANKADPNKPAASASNGGNGWDDIVSSMNAGLRR